MPPLLVALGWLKSVGAFIGNAMRNPWVIAALAVVATVACWRIEEGRVTAADARTAKVAAAWGAAFAQEQTSFRTVDGALKRQNAAVAVLGGAGRQETARATSAWSADSKAVAAAQKAASSRPAPDPRGDPAAEADTIFRASRQELK